MANAVIAATNLVDASGTQLSVQSTAGDLDALNLAEPSIQEVWRAQTATAWFQADLGSAQSIKGVAFAFDRQGLMPASADTAQIQLDIATAGAGTVDDTGAVAMNYDTRFGYYLQWYSTALSARYVRVTVASSEPYLQVGRFWVIAESDVVQPAINLAPGWSQQWVDLGQSRRAPRSGRRQTEPRRRYRSVELTYQYLTGSEGQTLDDVDADVGLTGQLFFCADPDDWSRKTVFGGIERIDPLRQPRPTGGSNPDFSKRLQITEDI